MRALLLLLLVVVVVSLASAIPADWQGQYDDGTLLYSAGVPDNAQLNATIGNGFVATAVGSDTTYMAGVFNGYNNTTPSHRARLPGFAALTLSAPGAFVQGLALDLVRAVHHTRVLVNGTVVQWSTYAHRVRREVVVVEVRAWGGAGAPAVVLQTHMNWGAPSEDVTAPAPVEGHPGCVSATALLAEDPGNVAPTRIVVCGPPLVPATLTLVPDGAATARFVWAFASSVAGADPLAVASAAYDAATSVAMHVLRSEHETAWAALAVHQRIVVEPAASPALLPLRQTLTSSLYYLLSSVRDDWDFSLSPGGLASNGYNGHTFWDAETWMLPALQLFYPELGASLLRYRVRRLAGAVRKAQSYAPHPYKGACFPWESAQVGIETCPAACRACASCTREIHINGDVALAAWQYYVLQPSPVWLEQVGFPLVEAMSRFWVSRATLNVVDGSYSIAGVVPPDEYRDNVTDSAFTNVGAAFTLRTAVAWARVLGVAVPDSFATVASALRVPWNNTLGIVSEYQGYNGAVIKQADVTLLGYPLPMASLNASARARNLAYYTPLTDPHGPAMTWGMSAIGLLEQGAVQLDAAHSLFEQSFAPYVHAPFCIWWETPTGGASNFLTGAGGFLQTLPFGYGGLRFGDAGDLQWANLEGVMPNGVKGGFTWRTAILSSPSICLRPSSVLSGHRLPWSHVERYPHGCQQHVFC